MSEVSEVETVSPSLLQNIRLDRWIDPEQCDLGPVVNEFLVNEMEESVFAAAAKLSEGALGGTGGSDMPSEFGEPVDEAYLEKLKCSAVQVKTRQQTKWAVSRWEAWALNRNRKRSVEHVPQLEGMTEPRMCSGSSDVSSKFSRKTARVYPPNTLYQLVVALQRNLCEKLQYIDIFQQVEFVDVKVTLDAEMKRLGCEGSGSVKKRAEAITKDQEQLALWSNGLLGDESPRHLLDTMVYNNGLYFALRSGREHRQLRSSPCQIAVVEPLGEKAYLKYVEDVSKNKQGGLKAFEKGGSSACES